MARKDEHVIIEAAINGETKPERNPNAPRKPEEIIADVFRCLDSGASIIHAHSDEIMRTGRESADGYLAAWRTIMAERPDTLWYPTLGAGKDMKESISHIDILAEEIAEATTRPNRSADTAACHTPSLAKKPSIGGTPASENSRISNAMARAGSFSA